MKYSFHALLPLFLFPLTGFSQYCIPTYANPCSSDDYIDGVDFAGISNSNTGCNGNADNYILVTNDTAYVNPLQSYPITLIPTALWNQGFGVWIDYNRDYDFADADEFVFSSPATTSPVTGIITIPGTITIGVTIMRIRAIYSVEPTAGNSCSQHSYGETEDYNIVIGSAGSDVGVITLLSPVSACALSNAETIIIEVKNFGSDTVTLIPVTYIVSSDTVVEFVNDTLFPSDTLIYTFTTPADISLMGSYIFKIYTSLAGDPQPGNDGISVTVENLPIISAFPYFENFDTFNAAPYNVGSPGPPLIPLGNGWGNDQSDDNLDWAPRSTPTQSPLTGPDYDHTSGNDSNTTQGKYLMVEDNYNADPVNLLSPCFNIITLPDPVMGFWYHSYNGTDTAYKSYLHVDIYYQGNLINDILPVITIEPVNQWYYKQVSLSSFPGDIRVRFRVNNNNSAPYHDIAIDDFFITDSSMVGFEVKNPENPSVDFPVTVFPNPVTDVINIQIPVGMNEELTAIIYGAAGQQVFIKKTERNNPGLSIDFREFDGGIYYLRIISGVNSILERFVVIK
ncbi:MAG: T9SS type A sorting domain-containing protein [Bacteroidetes bacterium]|nr:T9SS type A sorting domain-containing protein [Bacteroidota bacterium]